MVLQNQSFSFIHCLSKLLSQRSPVDYSKNLHNKHVENMLKRTQEGRHSNEGKRHEKQENEQHEMNIFKSFLNGNKQKVQET